MTHVSRPLANFGITVSVVMAAILLGIIGVGLAVGPVDWSGLALLPLLLGVYLLPVFIATGRHHLKIAKIAATDIFLGWTVIGWVVALVWSLSDGVKPAAAH